MPKHAQQPRRRGNVSSQVEWPEYADDPLVDQNGDTGAKRKDESSKQESIHRRIIGVAK
jgi:hypothetical protein